MSERDAVRAAFPEFAKVVDEYRSVFGDVRVKWVVEGGKARGRVPDEVVRQLGEGAE